MICQINGALTFFVFYFSCFFLRLIITCRFGLSMWGKIIIPMYRLWLHGLYGLYGPQCLLSPKRLINLISLSLVPVSVPLQPRLLMALLHMILPLKCPNRPYNEDCKYFFLLKTCVWYTYCWPQCSLTGRFLSWEYRSSESDFANCETF